MNAPSGFNLNTGVLASIALFLTAQSMAAIWWAASVDTKLSTQIDLYNKVDARLVRLEEKTHLNTSKSAEVMPEIEALRRNMERNTELLLRMMQDEDIQRNDLKDFRQFQNEGVPD